MIINEKIEIKISNKVLGHYKKTYKDLKSGDVIEILPTELALGSNKKIKAKCSNCNIIKEVVYYDYNKITNNDTKKYYCSKCKGIPIKETNQELYGVDNVFQLDSVKKQTKITCKEKYGTEHHLQNKDILQKLINTNQEKYGVNFIPQKIKHTQKSFIKKCNIIHNNLYDYKSSNYIDVITKVEIICIKHGSFWQMPTDHFRGMGCPKCKTSKGENEIIKYLDLHNIKYIHQKKFDGCKYKTELPFDFYLIDYNICIEFDGIQHSECVEYFGGVEAFELRKKKDKIKTKYCREHGIHLERITYSDNILDRLEIIL